MAGSTIAEVGDRFDGDLLGADPVSTRREAADGAIAAVEEPGALARTVHLSDGDRTGDEYITRVATDLAVHSWDLARAIGGDERLDPEVVEATWTAVRSFDPGIDQAREAGLFAPAVEVSSDASVQDRLLGLVGRRP